MKINKKALTYVGVSYGKTDFQIERMVSSFRQVEDHANWIILYDNEEKEKFTKYENCFVSKGIRNERVLSSLGHVKTKYLMIIDGDDFVDEVHSKNLVNELQRAKADLIFLNRNSQTVTNENSEKRSFFHASLNFVPNGIYSKKVLSKVNLYGYFFKDENNNGYKELKKIISTCDQSLSIYSLIKAKKITHLKNTSPYIRELNSSTSLSKGDFYSFSFREEIIFNCSDRYGYCGIGCVFFNDIKKIDKHSFKREILASNCSGNERLFYFNKKEISISEILKFSPNWKLAIMKDERLKRDAKQVKDFLIKLPSIESMRLYKEQEKFYLEIDYNNKTQELFPILNIKDNEIQIFDTRKFVFESVEKKENLIKFIIYLFNEASLFDI